MSTETAITVDDHQTQRQLIQEKGSNPSGSGALGPHPVEMTTTQDFGIGVMFTQKICGLA